MNILNFFNTPKKIGTIGISEFGTEEQISKLYEYKELASASAPVSLVTTSPERWKIWPKRNQMSQSSCTYHSRAKMAGILREMTTGEFVEYSACDYNKRSNKPAEGSSPIEAMDYLNTYGIGLEALEPSNNISALELANSKQTAFESDVAKISQVPKYASLDVGDFDAVVSTLRATGKPILCAIYAQIDEWNREVPTILYPELTPDKAVVRHLVCITPNFGIYNGEEGFTIEDSWGSTGIRGMGVRWITRKFFTKRNYIRPLVPTSFKGYGELNIIPAKPKFHFGKDLQKGMVDSDVYQLQQIFKYEGFFPANHAGSNIFGNITEKCTQQFQVKYGIASPGDDGFGRVGPKTRELLNQMYN